MILKSITITNLGPFYETLEIPIDPRVTVITGSNDVGKSSLLRALHLGMSETAADEGFINHDHVQNSSAIVTNDTSVRVVSNVILTDTADVQNPHLAVVYGDTAVVDRGVAPGVNSTRTAMVFSHHGRQNDTKLKWPAIVKPGTRSAGVIRNEIDLASPEDLERALLDAAFPPEFNFERLRAMNSFNYSRAIRNAENQLSNLMAKVLPNPGMLRIELMPIEGNRAKLGVVLRDAHNAMTAFGSRGSGVQRMLTFLAELLTLHRGAHHKIVLIDEPENSLHADAQHLLREFLFELTADGRTQVIYSTHSPSMIHPLRGDQVRLLIRTSYRGTATTRLQPKPDGANFLEVRSSLGMSAADSLLLAPVTVIAEGETETGCLPMLLRKAAPRLDGFDVEKLLGLITILDSMGDSFEYFARLAKQFGARVVLFLDGDKNAQIERLHGENKLTDVAIVLLAKDAEIEDLVPAKVYLKSLQELTEVVIEDAEQKLENWVAKDAKRRSRPFSKRVEGWFRDYYTNRYPTKRQIMKRAVELADVDEIDAAPLLKLIAAIKQQLEETSFD